MSPALTRRGRPLRARGIALRYGGRTAVDGVDLDAEPGRVTALIGPNGAGKTTLFACLSGLVRPGSGQVLLGDQDLTGMDTDARARAGLARTFQELAVFASLTVAENLRVGAENRRRGGVFAGLVGLPDRDRRAVDQTVDTTLRLLGLEKLRDVRAGGLPSGTLRMVELGRALAADPAALLLDEPASGLDDAETDRLRDVLRHLAADGLTVLLVEHDVDLVFDVADRIYVMTEGAVVATGTPAEVRSEPAVHAAYLGPA